VILPKSVIRLLIYSQIFVLTFLMLLPLMIRWLSVPIGKVAFALLTSGAIAFILAFGYALRADAE
jgi:hypothetical protein